MSVNIYNKTKDSLTRVDSSGSEDVYSTEETLTNKVWIDDKPIFRKVIQVDGSIASKFPMVIPDVENVVKFDAYVEWNSSTKNMSQLCMKPDNAIVPPLLYKITSDGLNISIISGSIETYYMSQVIIEYTKK